MLLDLSNPKDAHIDERLRAEPIIWLATTRPDGRPHLVPVWFFWDGETITIYSQPNNRKMRNLQHNPHVSLALNTADEGDDVVIVEGKAGRTQHQGGVVRDVHVPVRDRGLLQHADTLSGNGDIETRHGAVQHI